MHPFVAEFLPFRVLEHLVAFIFGATSAHLGPPIRVSGGCTRIKAAVGSWRSQGVFSLLQESVTVSKWNLLYQLIASESPVYRSSIGLFLDHPSSLLQDDIGSATFLTQQGHSGRRSKEGDLTSGLKPQRATKNAWPILIIEAGVSESLSQLYLDMQRWFDISNHEVKLVLLAKFDGTKILLEKWEEEMQQLGPVLRQSITITQNTTTNPISYHITSGTLVLSFRLLFLRDPGPGEGDFVISVQELEEYAENIWVEV